MFFAVCKHFLFLHQPSVFLHFLIIELIVRRDFADIRSSETFQKNDGPKLIIKILNKFNETVLESGFSVVAAAATGNEIVKEAFIDLKISEIFLKLLKERSGDCSTSMYDALRV